MKKALENNAVVMRIHFKALVCWSEVPTFHKENVSEMNFFLLKDAKHNLSALKWPNLLSDSANSIFLFQTRHILWNHVTFH